MKEFIIRDGKKLRLGYTTGSCAAAAAKAAAWMLLSGSKKESIRLLTPKGMELTLAVEDICLSPDCVRCAIRKDSGDDPDITRDTLIYAEVRKTETVGIVIDGGQGVGRVTKPGLDQPVGAAAINFCTPPDDPGGRGGGLRPVRIHRRPVCGNLRSRRRDAGEKDLQSPVGH
ncbi:MAG: cobalt-precorrin-5B (C(1))-methyltransferase [Oscillospiraceae bacterium]